MTTPFQEAGYTEDTIFRVANRATFFTVGERVKLATDDGTHSPNFRPIFPGAPNPCHLDKLEAVEGPGSTEKPKFLGIFAPGAQTPYKTFGNYEAADEEARRLNKTPSPRRYTAVRMHLPGGLDKWFVSAALSTGAAYEGYAARFSYENIPLRLVPAPRAEREDFWLVPTSPPTDTEEQPMPNSFHDNRFETRHFIDGVDASKLSEQQLIDAIADSEQEIARLENIQAKSERIAALIKLRKGDIDNMVEVLDARGE